MQLYTCQVTKPELPREIGVPFIDTSIKSGWSQLAPSWEMVMGHKNNDPYWTDERYAAVFNEMMRKSYELDPDFWEDLLTSETLCLGCWCKAGKFCHRLLLVDIIEAMCKERGIDFEYCGELK
ncbi:hypothetical protein [Vibrio phage vB_VmeM-Yong XC32]|nr:hypothetical protein [Vibrio phage vB_VmeM-Yong XC31]QAX96463.1 hypothetical protein [Vibrio phage vB_VmeM-Yong XC32]QAX96780.1 hypothetical protein [Vibrio phage vB_VmeM-Yong MS31]QAX97099.1 hypothetical protein [Vibrio phage vB_VmeM-Yong MS32]